MNDEADVLREVAAPLLAETERLQAELVEVDEKRDEILRRLRRLEGAVNRLFPPPPKPPKLKGMKVDSQNAREIQKFLESRNGDLPDGFTGTEVYRMILANGSPLVGKEATRRAINVLHERGVVRLDRKGQGGAKVFKLVGS